MLRNESDDVAPRRADLFVALPFLATALMVGGAGTRYPLLALVVELLAIATFILFVPRKRIWSFALRSPLVVLVVLGILLLPLVQLVPLPPGVWSDLSGREVEKQLFELTGQADAWMPVTIDSEATWLSFFSLLPGLAAFIVVLALNDRKLPIAAWLIAATAVVSAILGTLQAVSGGSPDLWGTAQVGHSPGLLTNRNHQALLLNIGIVFVAALGSLRGAMPDRFIAAAAAVFLAAAVVITRSRTGAALLLLTLPFAGLLLVRARVGTHAMIVAGAGVIAVLGLLFTSVGQLVLDRFGAAEDARFVYWEDVWIAIDNFWPTGSGFGTFRQVYESVERLTNVSPSYVNHAHNDYLQLLLEGGAAAAALVGLGILLLARAAWKSLQADRRKLRLLAAASAMAVLAVLLHSVVDYPLRMASLLVIFGLSCGLLLRIGTSTARSRA